MVYFLGMIWGTPMAPETMDVELQRIQATWQTPGKRHRRRTTVAYAHGWLVELGGVELGGVGWLGWLAAVTSAVSVESSWYNLHPPGDLTVVVSSWEHPSVGVWMK